VDIQTQRPLPPDVKVALYRVAQEALNNVAKHAKASRVTVSLHDAAPMRARSDVGGVELSISDDGRGFDPTLAFPEHFGLGIMRERAEAIGATLDIKSELGQGTQVLVVWRAARGEEPGKG
jgi:signal transduction histidine kinase